MSEFSTGEFENVSKEEQIRRLHEAVINMSASLANSREIDGILSGDRAEEPQPVPEVPIPVDEPSDDEPEDEEAETSVETEDETAAPV